MAVPIAYRFHSTQSRITLNMTCVGFATIAYEYNISFSRCITIITYPIHIILLSTFIFKLSSLYFKLLSLMPEVIDLHTTVGAPIRRFQPLLQTIKTELVLAFYPALILYLVQTYCTFILLQLF